jgi:flagellar FliJ protein
MRRFHFPLDPALRVRSQLEEQAQIELAETRRRLERQRAALDEILRQMVHHDRHRAQWQQSQVDPRALTAADPYRQELELDLAAARAASVELEAAVDRCLLELHRRRVDREMLDRLRERRRAEHREQELQEEQKSLDEVAVLRWRRD